MCGTRRGRRQEGGSCCPGAGRVRGFIQPQILLLLAQAPRHGYELMDLLGGDEDAPGVDPGFLYRTLRRFEKLGLVQSSWDTERQGPARRVYKITPEGVEYLHAWVANVRRTRQRLDRFLADYQSFCERG